MRNNYRSSVLSAHLEEENQRLSFILAPNKSPKAELFKITSYFSSFAPSDEAMGGLLLAPPPWVLGTESVGCPLYFWEEEPDPALLFLICPEEILQWKD